MYICCLVPMAMAQVLPNGWCKLSQDVYLFIFVNDQFIYYKITLEINALGSKCFFQTSEHWSSLLCPDLIKQIGTRR